jgi:uncharacterized protein YdeI (YjbR/CyaY-like superfamily)
MGARETRNQCLHAWFLSKQEGFTTSRRFRILFPMPDTLPVKFFPTAAAFRKWLVANHAKVDGLWLRICKEDSGKKSITYAEALDEALCFGWIDGMKKGLDELSWAQRFTPRRPKSGWSKINTAHAERLSREGKMHATGLWHVEAAKADGRWKAAYDSPKTAKPPADFLKALSQNKKAKAFFLTLNKANVYAIVYRLQTAKKLETRQRRMAQILAQLEAGKKLHP